MIIHRAVLGSVERMFAILTEHYAGKWPFFLSPRQVMIVPVTKAYAEYAQRVQSRIKHAGYYVDVDTTARTLNKMVREAQLAQYNYILVVGADEEKNGTASVRARDNAQHGSKPVDELIAEFARMTADHVLDLQLGVDAAEGQEGLKRGEEVIARRRAYRDYPGIGWMLKKPTVSPHGHVIGSTKHLMKIHLGARVAGGRRGTARPHSPRARNRAPRGRGR